MQATEPEVRNRDIILCLDGSGSMDRYNAEVVRQFREIVSGLRGERVGMTIFSGASITAFPLTDDYEFLTAELDRAEKAFRGERLRLRRRHPARRQPGLPDG